MQKWYEILMKLTLIDMVLIPIIFIVMIILLWCGVVFVKVMREEQELMRRLVSEADPSVNLSGSILDVIIRYGK